MTNKEVIEWLKYIKWHKADKDTLEPIALDMAIKTLEKEENTNSANKKYGE